MRAVYQYARKYHVQGSLLQPLHIGSGEENNGAIMRHPITDTPFLPGTGIAGSFASYVENTYGESEKEKWFGASNEKGNFKSRLSFLDGMFVGNSVKTELRTHVKLNAETGTVDESKHSGQLTFVEYISKGEKIVFDIYDFSNEADISIAEECLCQLHNGNILFGGQISNGCGRIKIESILMLQCDMRKKEERLLWKKEEANKEMVDVTSDVLKKKDNQKQPIEICAKVSFNQDLLVKSNVVDLIELDDKNISIEPDAMQVKNGNREYMIPGSSIKGVVRNQMEKIADYLNLSKEEVDLIFENGGKLIFYDAILQNVKEHPIVRNRINKFTGGVMDKALFFELPISGASELVIRMKNIHKSWDDEIYKKTLALLMLSIRDISLGMTSFGSGTSVGRGIAAVDEIYVRQGEKELIYLNPASNEVRDDQGYLTACLEELQEG